MHVVQKATGRLILIAAYRKAHQKDLSTAIAQSIRATGGGVRIPKQADHDDYDVEDLAAHMEKD